MFGKKSCFLIFEWVKWNFTTFGPLENLSTGAVSDGRHQIISYFLGPSFDKITTVRYKRLAKLCDNKSSSSSRRVSRHSQRHRVVRNACCSIRESCNLTVLALMIPTSRIKCCLFVLSLSATRVFKTSFICFLFFALYVTQFGKMTKKNNIPRHRPVWKQINQRPCLSTHCQYRSSRLPWRARPLAIAGTDAALTYMLPGSPQCLQTWL